MLAYDQQCLADVPNLNEEALLSILKCRYEEGKFCTWLTRDILVLLNANPSHESKQLENQGGVTNICNISAQAYQSFLHERQSQTIVVLGDASGSGKTETWKHLQQQLLKYNQIHFNQKATKVPPLPEAIGCNSPDRTKKCKSSSNQTMEAAAILMYSLLLETFGNAKTRDNFNSSRFAQYVQLKFLTTSGTPQPIPKFWKSQYDVFLLDKNRIAERSEHERAFHIFYQLLAIDDDEKKKIWNDLDQITCFKYIGKTTWDDHEHDQKKLKQQFASTKEALAAINIVDQKVRDYLRASCIVLLCGNLVFDVLKDSDDSSQITSHHEADQLADLLGVETQDLVSAFTTRMVVARGETYSVYLDANFAKQACDKFACELYSRIFSSLVNDINMSANSTSEKDKEFGAIGLLDSVAFEHTATDPFRQFCVNYTNEKMQQKFVRASDCYMQKVYEKQGIGFLEVSNDRNNKDVLDIFESTCGLLPFLNEETVRRGGRVQDWLCTSLNTQRKRSTIFRRVSNLSFLIAHFAGDINYDATCFVKNNRNDLSLDLFNLCQNSLNSVVSACFRNKASAVHGGRRNRPKRFVCSAADVALPLFQSQLSSLMDRLKESKCHYVRCIRVNYGGISSCEYDDDIVAEQIRASGIVKSCCHQVTLSEIQHKKFFDQWVMQPTKYITPKISSVN